jgi:hypothetical protein
MKMKYTFYAIAFLPQVLTVFKTDWIFMLLSHSQRGSGQILFKFYIEDPRSSVLPVYKTASQVRIHVLKI